VSDLRGRAGTYVAVGGLLALAALFASLGNWQLDRAAMSRATLERFASGAEADELPRLPIELDESLRFRRIEVSGEYVVEPQFLLDNLLHDGVAGYQVVTAFRVSGMRERLLVNRGWVPAAADRRVLPVVTVEPGQRRLSGRLERLPRPGLRLGETAEPPVRSPVLVMQYPTAGELAQALGEPVLDYQLLLDAGAPDGYVRDWKAPGIAPERHVSYAGQWLALAAGALGAALYMAFRMARRR
jgi:surfeit locus 1 family protein